MWWLANDESSYDIEGLRFILSPNFGGICFFVNIHYLTALPWLMSPRLSVGNTFVIHRAHRIFTCLFYFIFLSLTLVATRPSDKKTLLKTKRTWLQGTSPNSAAYVPQNVRTVVVFTVLTVCHDEALSDSIRIRKVEALLTGYWPPPMGPFMLCSTSVYVYAPE